MNILIIGAGAVGIGVGAGLISSGENVTFLASGETKTALEKNGCQRIGVFNDIIISPDKFSVIDSYSSDASFDFILIASKTMSNERIARELSEAKNLFNSDTKIVIMQNGLGTNDYYEEFFDKSAIYNGRIITGFSRPERYISQISVHREPLLLGSMYGFPKSAVEPLADAINASGYPSVATDDIVKPIWSKVIYNCALNPLGAIFNSPYGFLGECASAREYVCHIIDEAFAVMHAAGFSTYAASAYDYEKELFEKTLPLTGLHRSSTLQDIIKKQPTEIDTLNGAIVKMGRRFGVPTPYNDAITLIIKGIEDSNK